VTSLRVLLVDDEEELVSVLAERLEFRGITVRAACSGAEAVECARHQEFDMALVDVKMPEMSGMDTMLRIKEIQPLIKVILMTGHGESSEVEEHLARGAYDYVAKPIQIDDLIGKIRKTIDESESHGAEE
jgi:two-component system, OmpR family, response regulator